MRLSTIVLAALVALALPARAQHQARALDHVPINELISEIQKTSPAKDTVDLVWWLPPEFWAVSLAGVDGVDDSMRQEIRELFGKYIVVAAVKGSIGNFGVNGYLTEEELRGKLRLVAPGGSVQAPIPAEDLDPRLGVVIGALKPMFTSVLGDLGKNLNFYAFPARENGKPLVDALGDGTMTVQLDNADYAFRLPLNSLLVPAQDPKTGERFPGSYRFNPYSGGALRPAASE